MGQSYLKRFGKKIANRDGGWVCHYCGIALVPAGTSYEDPEYHDEFETEDFVTGNMIPVWYLKPGFQYANVDHKICRSAGGSDDLSNLVLACIVCNNARGTMPYEVFKRRKRRVVQS